MAELLKNAIVWNCFKVKNCPEAICPHYIRFFGEPPREVVLRVENAFGKKDEPTVIDCNQDDCIFHYRR